MEGKRGGVGGFPRVGKEKEVKEGEVERKAGEWGGQEDFTWVGRCRVGSEGEKREMKAEEERVTKD